MPGLITMRKLVSGFLLFWVFLLPWQTRWIIKEGFINGEKWEYGTVSIYAAEFILGLLLFFWAFNAKKDKLAGFWKKKTILLAAFLIFFALFSFLIAKPTWSSFFIWLHFLGGAIIFLILQFSEVQSKIIAKVFVAAMFIQGLLGIIQFFTQSVFGSKWLGMASSFPEILGASVIETNGTRFLRAYGSFPHPNIFGGYLVVAIIFLFWLLDRRPTSIYHRCRTSIIFVLITSLFFTFSRASWLALGVVVALHIIQAFKRKKIALTVLPGLIILYFVLLSIFYWPLVATRLTRDGRLEVKSMAERINSFNEAKFLISRHPFLGVGIGNYTKAVFREIDTGRSGWDYQPVHNTFVLVLVELGIVGLILFISIFFLVPKIIFFTPLIPLLFFDHYFWSLYPGIMLFWFTLGMAEKIGLDKKNKEGYK